MSKILSMHIRRIDRENYQRSVQWCQQADSRASVILAFNGALIALLLIDTTYTSEFIEHLQGRSFNTSEMYASFFFALFLVAFVFSSVSALRVLMLDARKTRCELNNVFSFMNITDMTREEYRKRLNEVSEDAMVHAWQDQTYLVAQLARRKLRWMNHGWWYLAGGLFSVMAFIVIIIFF